MTRISAFCPALLCVALLFGGCVTKQRQPQARRRAPAHLHGAVRNATYTSAEGGFSVAFPVSADVEGRVLEDGPRTVTFIDNWGSRITFTEQPILEQSSMKSMMETQGREKALSEFARREYGAMAEVHFHPETLDGTISFIYLRPASPKTAVAVFVHGDRLFLVETDMLPGVSVLAQNDLKSQEERDTWLEGTAVALAKTIEIH